MGQPDAPCTFRTRSYLHPRAADPEVFPEHFLASRRRNPQERGYFPPRKDGFRRIHGPARCDGGPVRARAPRRRPLACPRRRPQSRQCWRPRFAPRPARGPTRGCAPRRWPRARPLPAPAASRAPDSFAGGRAPCRWTRVPLAAPAVRPAPRTGGPVRTRFLHQRPRSAPRPGRAPRAPHRRPRAHAIPSPAAALRAMPWPCALRPACGSNAYFPAENHRFLAENGFSNLRALSIWISLESG